MVRLYSPHAKPQLTGTPLGHVNCNMAAAAVTADRATLGAVNVSADAMRTASGDKLGGTTLQGAATALAAYGVHLNIHPPQDRETLDDLWDHITNGNGVILDGDYDVVPNNLSGQPAFDGTHAVYLQYAGMHTMVWDSLADGRRPGIPQSPIVWPRHIIDRFANKYPGLGISYGVITRHFLRADARTTNIRAKATRNSPIIGTFMRGAELERGRVKLGESIGGDRRWYRVWSPDANAVGFVHASVSSLV